jgi:hypothetical protein
MSIFDKICAVPAFLFGLIMLPLGLITSFTGIDEWALKSWPVVAPLIFSVIGWGIIRSVWFAWKASHVVSEADLEAASKESRPDEEEIDVEEMRAEEAETPPEPQP